VGELAEVGHEQEGVELAFLGLSQVRIRLLILEYLVAAQNGAHLGVCLQNDDSTPFVQVEHLHVDFVFLELLMVDLHLLVFDLGVEFELDLRVVHHYVVQNSLL